MDRKSLRQQFEQPFGGSAGWKSRQRRRVSKLSGPGFVRLQIIELLTFLDRNPVKTETDKMRKVTSDAQ